MIQQPTGEKDITHSKELVRVPVGPGIFVPGIFMLGCTVPVTVGVTMSTDVSFLTLVGANFKWPDMGVTINIKGICKIHIKMIPASDILFLCRRPRRIAWLVSRQLDSSGIR
jgi:hypothetical protein